jgi:hypothetical protein
MDALCWVDIANPVSVGNTTAFLMRLLPDGSFDSSFDEDGSILMDLGQFSVVQKILLQPNGALLASIIYAPDNVHYIDVLMRFDESGNRLKDFGTNGELLLPVADVQALNDGRILSTLPDGEKIKFTMWLPNGVLDESFGQGGVVRLDKPGPNTYLSEAVQKNNKLFFSGVYQEGLIRSAQILALEIKQPNLIVSSFTLLNSTSDKDIRTLEDSTVINLAEIKGKGINIRANTEGEVGSLRMQLSGTLARTQTENIAPYALFGNTGGNYKHWRPQTGSYTLEAIPFAQVKGAGAAGAAHTVSFRIIDSLTLSGLTLMNAETNKPIGPLQDGAVIDLDKTPYINIRANTGVGVTESVRFSVNDSSYRVENILPFALAADYKGRYYPWQVTPGTYTVTATPYSQNGAVGKAGYPLTVTIQIINSNAKPAAIAQSQMEVPKASLSTGVSLSAYPNPATIDTYVQYKVAKTAAVSITLVDQKGTTVR